MPEIIDVDDFKAALKELNNKGPMDFELSPIEAWVVLGQLQLALRHHENTGEVAKIARRIAERIQGVVASEGVLKAVAEAGWQEVGEYG